MRFELTILGTSGAVPAYGRFCSGALLRTEHEDVLIDCGEGTQMQLQRAGLGLGKCSTILITHLHGDHYFGLPGLLSGLSLSGRTRPLHLYSPLHLRPRLSALFELDRYPMSYELHFHTLEVTELMSVSTGGELEISAFPLRHRTPTNGYLIREKAREPNLRKDAIEKHAIPWQELAAIKQGAGFTRPDGTIIPHAELTLPAPPPRSFAYCSDTLYFPELAGYVSNVDLLYHEATFLDDMRDDALKKGHSTALEAARTARDAHAGQLILGHFSSRYPDVSGHEREARTLFPNSFAAGDLNQYTVPFVGRG